MFSVFEKEGSAKNDAVDTRELHAQIGQLKVENEFLKKVAANWVYGPAGTVGYPPRSEKVSIRKQCDLLSINRSKLYYKPENVQMMNIMDRAFN